MAKVSQFNAVDIDEGPLAADTVLTMAPKCTVRHLEDQFMVYNPDTDELHLLPHTAYLALRMCDGLATVGNVSQRLGHAWTLSQEDAQAKLAPFFGGLVDRGILEVRDDLR